MEKTFRRLSNRNARRAYVEAEVLNGLAHQIRVLRQQRNWTQAHLAKCLGTTQAVVSRLEDPSYGKFSLRTLLQLSNVFDVGLFVRFMPFTKLLQATEKLDRANFEAESYETEAEVVGTFTESAKHWLLVSPPSSCSQSWTHFISKSPQHHTDQRSAYLLPMPDLHVGALAMASSPSTHLMEVK